MDRRWLEAVGLGGCGDEFIEGHLNQGNSAVFPDDIIEISYNPNLDNDKNIRKHFLHVRVSSDVRKLVTVVFSEIGEPVVKEIRNPGVIKKRDTFKLNVESEKEEMQGDEVNVFWGEFDYIRDAVRTLVGAVMFFGDKIDRREFNYERVVKLVYAETDKFYTSIPVAPIILSSFNRFRKGEAGDFFGEILRLEKMVGGEIARSSRGQFLSREELEKVLMVVESIYDSLYKNLLGVERELLMKYFDIYGAGLNGLTSIYPYLVEEPMDL